MTMIHSDEQGELFENVLLNVGNMIYVSEGVRMKLFGTQIMDLILLRYKIFEDRAKPAEYMVWLISNILNNKFHLMDGLQFSLFNKAVAVFVRHSNETNYLEILWALRYLLSRESNMIERLQCIMKTNILGLIAKHIQNGLEISPCPSWMAHSLEVYRCFCSKASSSYCNLDLVEVSIHL